MSLSERFNQGDWTITLSGPKAGISYVSITTNDLTGIDPDEIHKYLEKKLKAVEIEKVQEYASMGSLSLVTRHKKYRKTPIEIEWSGGSGGCGISIHIGNNI